MRSDTLKSRALGKWRSILPMLGVPADYLTGKHSPCPICQGKDRFRFDDKSGTGSYYCNGCGAGTGIDLVMKLHKIDFAGARTLIEPLLPDATVVVPKAQRSVDPMQFVDQWRAAAPLSGSDPASWFLGKRGLTFDQYPTQLRFAPKATYTHEDKTRTQHPAMLALFVAPDAKTQTVHFTYLDSIGNKAKLPKVRKLAPGRVPQGGAVRLAPSAETMGIAEGIETALSAMRLFDVPVWAALSAGALIKWQPPPTARSILIFGDRDRNFAGQAAATALAHRLSIEGYHVEVRLPDEFGDWNDVFMSHADQAGGSPPVHLAPAHDWTGQTVHRPMGA